MVASSAFGLPGLSRENTHLCTIEASVTTGLESVAADECNIKFKTNVKKTRGRIGFDVEIDEMEKILTLKCIDNIAVIIGEVENIEFKDTKEESLDQIKAVFHSLDWEKGLKALKKMKNVQLERDEMSFRVTCTRVGKKHKFQSPEASKVMGAIINDTFGWKVDLTHFDVQVLLNICDHFVYVGLSLVDESLHKRNLKFFGPATLRPTISHCLLRLALIEAGDVVCDPACGSGSIIVEGVLTWTDAMFVAGDIHDVAYTKTKQNIDTIRKQKKFAVDIFQWDATNLPMRNNSIDVIVTDLPFGKKMGNKRINRTLYPQMMMQFVRTVKTTTGRAVVLTADRKQMILVLRAQQMYWKVSRQTEVNVGGLSAVVYLLKRTDVEFREK